MFAIVIAIFLLFTIGIAKVDYQIGNSPLHSCQDHPLDKVSTASMSANAIVQLTNKARQEYKLNPLCMNSALNEAALARAQDMEQNNYFGHTSPDGTTPWHYIRETGYYYTIAGENLASMFDASPHDVVGAWLESDTHRDNIFNKNFTQVGVAIIETKKEEQTHYLIVQIFGNPYGKN